jgi:transcriptional regulator with XRE-family HTH domain
MDNTYPVLLRKLRARLNFSQEDLAKLLNVSFSSINRWENGHHEPTIISKEKLKELFITYNIKINEESSKK